MRRSDAIVVVFLSLCVFTLTVPVLVRMRQLANGTRPEQIGMTRVDATNFDQEVGTSTKPVILVFYSIGFSQPEGEYWAEFGRRNSQWKLVAIEKNSPLWGEFNSGIGGGHRAFLWFPRLQSSLPLALTGDMDVMADHINGMIGATGRQ